MERAKAESYMLQHEKRAHRSQSELAQSAKAACHIQSIARSQCFYFNLYLFRWDFFPICEFTLSSSYHWYRFAFLLRKFHWTKSQVTPHSYMDRVSRSSDTWLFIILTQIINGSNVPTERNSIWTNKVNICTRSSTNRPIN